MTTRDSITGKKMPNTLIPKIQGKTLTVRNPDDLLLKDLDPSLFKEMRDIYDKEASDAKKEENKEEDT